MSKRLQVLLNLSEFRIYQRLARTQGVSLGEWVRHALRQTSAKFSTTDADEKIRKIRKLSQNNFPSGNIDQILDEIEKGYLK